MWLQDEVSLIAADRTFIKEYAGWVSTIHRTESHVLAAAMRQSDDRDVRKAISTRLLNSRMHAELAIGALYVGIQRRLETSLIQARLNAEAEDVRAVFRSGARTGEQSFWEFLNLPSPEQVRSAAEDPAVANEYVDSCERRLVNLRRVSEIARQDMLLAAPSPGLFTRILVGMPRSVGIIKTGRETELPELSNTAFYLLALSDGAIDDPGDLVAIACPTTPAVIESIVEEVAFIDEEAGETAALVDLVAEAGLLRTSFESESAAE